ncbi:MAG: hypothetical protein AAF599_00365 [Bacteroidota bacterium]
MRYPNQFPVTGIMWHQYQSLVMPHFTQIKVILNEMLSISNYGTSVEGLAFLYIVDQPGSDFHEETLKYDKKNKELYGQFSLNPEEILPLEDHKILAVMAKMYWERTADFKKFKLKDFDLDTFRADVKEMFETTGLMPAEAAASEQESARATES